VPPHPGTTVPGMVYSSLLIDWLMITTPSLVLPEARCRSDGLDPS
jgi:hypothetical protein